MTQPLLANPKRVSEAHVWHRKVFAKYGYRCLLCGAQATDAAHVIGRGMRLGPLRYADPRFGRPLCRRCHTQVDRNEKEWPDAIVRDAIIAHNKLAKIPIHLPPARRARKTTA